MARDRPSPMPASRPDSPPWSSPSQAGSARRSRTLIMNSTRPSTSSGGQLLVVGEGEPQQAVPGSMFVAARGHRHGFSNPSDEPARVLGVWAPAEPALAFMRDIGSEPDP